MVEEWGEARAVPQMRKHLGYYLKGIPGASALRETIDAHRVRSGSRRRQRCAIVRRERIHGGVTW